MVDVDAKEAGMKHGVKNERGMALALTIVALVLLSLLVLVATGTA